MMTEKTIVCQGTHGGENNMCEHCLHNKNWILVQNHYEHKSYSHLNPEVCRLKFEGKYWSQYETSEVKQ